MKTFFFPELDADNEIFSEYLVEYCEKYAKPENVTSPEDEVSSEDECSSSDDDEVARNSDPSSV